jgi:hypothetical protein
VQTAGVRDAQERLAYLTAAQFMVDAFWHEHGVPRDPP